MTVYAQELITCYPADGCSTGGAGTVFEEVTIQDCCDNVNGGGQNGIGLGNSYRSDNALGCRPCPVGECLMCGIAML